MSKDKILVVWSNYYKDLAEKQLESCRQCLEHLNYEYAIETIAAGSYEIPAVIRYYHRNAPHAGYLPLSLLLKGSTDHYEWIREHLRQCFTQFAMEGLLLGNGVIFAPNRAILTARVENQERVREAVQALDYLIQFKAKL